MDMHSKKINATKPVFIARARNIYCIYRYILN